MPPKAFSGSGPGKVLIAEANTAPNSSAFWHRVPSTITNLSSVVICACEANVPRYAVANCEATLNALVLCAAPDPVANRPVLTGCLGFLLMWLSRKCPPG